MLADGQLHRSADCVQICQERVFVPDIVAAPEFEELRARQRSGSYKAARDIRLLYDKVHPGQNILGYFHSLSFAHVRH
jgi:hypothetical protein